MTKIKITIDSNDTLLFEVDQSDIDKKQNESSIDASLNKITEICIVKSDNLLNKEKKNESTKVKVDHERYQNLISK